MWALEVWFGMGGAGRDKGKPGGVVRLSGCGLVCSSECGRESDVRCGEGAGCEAGGRGPWVGSTGSLRRFSRWTGEVGRGDGAPCQPGWHSQDRGLPTVPSATLLFLRLRFQAGFVEVTWGWPQVPGVLPWSRGEADSVPAAPSYSGGREEHVLERFLQGGTVYMRRMAGPGLGQSPSGGKQTFQEACLNVQPAQLLRGLCFSDV